MSSKNQDKVDYQKLAEYYKNKFLIQLKYYKILEEKLRKSRQKNVEYEMMIEEMKCRNNFQDVNNQQQIEEMSHSDAEDENLHLELTMSESENDEDTHLNHTNNSKKRKTMDKSDFADKIANMKVEVDSLETSVHETSQEQSLQNRSINRADISVDLSGGKYKLKINNKEKLSNKNRLMCPCCNMTFKDRIVLHIHMKKTHLCKKPKDNVNYSCHICDIKFKSANSLSNHLNISHKNHKFKCSNCGVLFKTGTGLGSHMKKGPCLH